MAVTDGKGGSGGGNISITVTSATGGTVSEIEPNGSRDTVQLISADTDYLAVASYNYDSDYFKITANGNLMTVNLTHVTQNASGSDFRIYIL